jgi:hypothetical protein
VSRYIFVIISDVITNLLFVLVALHDEDALKNKLTHLHHNNMRTDTPGPTTSPSPYRDASGFWYMCVFVRKWWIAFVSTVWSPAHPLAL